MYEVCRRPLGAGRPFLQKLDEGRRQTRLSRLVRYLPPQSLASSMPTYEPALIPHEAEMPRGFVALAVRLGHQLEGAWEEEVA